MPQILSSVKYNSFRQASSSNMRAPTLLLAPGTIEPPYAPEYTPLSESNTNGERLWVNSVDRDEIFWAGIQLLDGQQEAHVNTELPQHPQKLLRGTWPYIYPSSTKHVYTSLECSRDFLKICWRVEICSVVLRPRRKPHWVSSSFGSIIFAASWHIVYSSWEAKQRDAAVVGSFTPVSLFVCEDDQFTIKLFAVSIKLVFSSGIRKLLMHSSMEAFAW